MSVQTTANPDASPAGQLTTPARSIEINPSSLGRSIRLSWASRWEWAVAVVAVVAAVAAFWVTIDAKFLAYPDWLAVQKADFILGPVGVGLYWRHRRPHNRLGLLLIVLGLVGVVYILQSSTVPALFGIGLLCEFAIGWWTLVLILAFPSGRLEGLVPRLLAGVWLFGVVVPGVVFCLTASTLVPSLPISGCKTVCPRNGLALWSQPSWLPQLLDVAQVAIITVGLATVGLLVWRFATGTRPRRRALAIGAPIAVLFSLALAGYWMKYLIASHSGSPSQEPVGGVLRWTYAGAPSVLWYGFLFALIGAELFAGRVLRDVVRRSLGRPSLRELEGMLRGPLGDPGLRLGFWRLGTGNWAGHDGAVLRPPEDGQRLTEVDRAGRPAAAIVHDAQLSEDPELLQAAGAAALLAQENAELDAAWKESVRELAGSRARLASASERERRKLERDLHDGAQQRLVAASINLTLADEAGDERELHERIADSRTEIEQALIELREISHGIYPTALARSGLSRAFNLLADRYPGLTVSEAMVRRFSPEVELAVYYCGLEAVQNAAKHAGPEARTWIRLYVNAGQLHLEVRDNGQGFEVDRAREGVGLQNMRDRLGAVGGRVEVISNPGSGTLLTASTPITPQPHDPAAERSRAPDAITGTHTH